MLMKVSPSLFFSIDIVHLSLCSAALAEKDEDLGKRKLIRFENEAGEDKSSDQVAILTEDVLQEQQQKVKKTIEDDRVRPVIIDRI